MATIEGADMMRDIARSLRDLRDKELKREFAKALTRTIEPLKAEIAASALQTLPRRGGLANRVAHGTRFRVARSANGSVRLVGKNTALKDLRRMDDPGVVRHPVFQRAGQARRSVPWVRQEVTPGWFSGPLDAAKPRLQAAMLEAAADMAARVEGRRNL